MTHHALCVRLTAPIDTRGMWVEDMTVPATDPLAARRRAVELSRPAADVRCVLLRYTDGLSDLVVVAPRTQSVRAAAASLLGIPALASVTPQVEAVDLPPPEWGLGSGSGVSTYSVECDTSSKLWPSALEFVLGQYGPTDAVGLLTDTGPDLPDATYVPCLEPIFPLTVSVLRDRLRFDYRLSHFSTEIVTQFAAHLLHVHSELARGATPSLLNASEIARIVSLGQSSPLTSTPLSLPEAFGRIAAAQPSAVAVGDATTSLTYAELDTLSGRMADGLRAAGVCGGDKVVVCLERTAELVVVLLAVLKVGAAYVPVDPAYPVERLSYTAQDAAARLVVTRLAEFPSASVVTPDALFVDPVDAQALSISPDSPAYVIYTSGSTGRPKGVVVPHRNVVSLVDATRDEYRLDASDTWTLFHSSAFDFSVWEIWGCLLTGGRLVVVSYDDSREPSRFRDLLVSEKVTVLSQTPSAFAQLLDVRHESVPVRLVVFGGEPLDARMLLRWFDTHPSPGCRVVNMFGITETTVHVTHQTFTRAMALAASRSVGPALPGWHVYVMDQAGNLVPPGVAGEIHVGGAGVALGYLNQPELSASRFLPDPFRGGTMYRSGDLGRLRPDGSLLHLGRIDSQVKIRGFRIELDEIRAVLLEDPDVGSCAVVVRGNGASARIDAYVVPASLDTAGVRKRASTVLPSYMVPASVTALDALPLTTNGKLDQEQLPVPAVSTPVSTPVSVAPADEGSLSVALQEVWGTVFGVPVGVDDDFYALGGNSLLAVRINAALRERRLPTVKLRDLFRHPTIRSVVQALQGVDGSGG
nr:non-ribosomal peptide synthetase [Kibdelosporangium sp. MJ126-NF4]CEL14442.1 non-ribosomal peptide synthetase [Kibdelosporangium sp. MJ126-NF4]CTQ88807.1 non-ribosomal peptide synthetase [Kibdelosporangium sp. MJ126-NF4]